MRHSTIPEGDDPFSTSGATVTFVGCQTGSSGMALLGTVQFFAASLVTNHYLSVVARNPPSNPMFDCPLLVLCDAPVFTELCVPGGQGIVNGPPCTVATVQTTWSRVRRMYD